MHYTPLPYLDPGSTNFLVQLVIAALLGVGIALRASWGRIKTIFGAKPKADGDHDDDDPAE